MNTVSTKLGKIDGLYEEPGVYVWKGVRYAKPPVGELRFKAPSPIDAWEGVVNAHEFGHECPQINLFADTNAKAEKGTDEDCLFLNIWSRTLEEKNPVMVYIHGGAYKSGSGSQNIYHGHNISYNHNVVVVTINYRLGAFGYIHFNHIQGSENRFDSNCGLRDQVAALEWVRDNISAFGGDPNNVTIFGESAGGNAVITLMAVPSAKGLFHKVIAQSPAASSLATKWSTFASTEFLKSEGIKDLSDVLTIDAEKLVDVTQSYFYDMSDKMPGCLGLCPFVDGDFLPLHPLDAIRNGSSEGIPLLIGFNKDESNLFTKLAARTGKNLLISTPSQVDAYFSNNTHLDKSKILSSYQSQYPQNGYINRLGADIAFNIFAIQVAEAQSAHAPTFMYRYDFVSIVQRVMGLGATHAMEIPFVFGDIHAGPMKMLYYFSNTKNIKGISNRMQSAWTSFAKTGNPGMNDWTQYGISNRSTKVFDNQDHIVHDLQSEHRILWEGLSCYLD
ncbi:carboxylesterase [Acrasis kona]|uniref:Carboxylic ester hydrolase n=1 Tax=Acrasis kona TaxID=1008807 RepID=A0AAW2Z439_9EUKA